MSPIKIEICGETITAGNNEKGGINIFNTDLGFAYIGKEDGGRVVFARKTNSLDHKYDYKEPVIIHKGEDPIFKEIECRSIGGQKKIIKATIAAI